MIPFTHIFTAMGLADIGEKLFNRRLSSMPTDPENPIDATPRPSRHFSPVAVSIGRVAYITPTEEGVSEVGYPRFYIHTIDDEQTPAAQAIIRNEFDVYGGSVVDAIPVQGLTPLKV